VQQGDTAGVAKIFQESIRNNPNIFGAADIYSFRLQNPLTLAGILSGVLMGLVDADQKPAILKFVVIVPPESNAEDCENKFWSELASTYRLLAQRELEPHIQAWMKKNFRLIIASDWRTSSILDLIRVLPERTSIIIAEAASYRDDDIEPYIAKGAESPSLPEDVWAPQLYKLANEANKLAKERLFYVALDAYQFCPKREALTDLLCSIDGCGILVSENENSPDSILAARVDQWETWIREGRLGKVFHDIEQLPANLDRNKPYLRIQILNKAGLFIDALHAIRHEMEIGDKLDANTKVKLARIAQDANASRLAMEILAPAINELHNREDLESALATAHDADSTEVEKKIAERLSALFPGSPGLQQRHLRALLENRDYNGVASLLADEQNDKAEFYRTIARFLSGDSMPDYKGLIASAGSDISQAEAYRMECVSDAISRMLIPQAFELALPLPYTPGLEKRGEKLLLNSLKHTLLQTSKEESLIVLREKIEVAIISLIERLSSNPENQELRVSLTHLLEPSISGTRGFALIAFIVLNLLSKPIRIKKYHDFGEADIDWLLERKTFIRGAFEWLDSEGPIIMGRSTLPSSLLTEPADEVISAITSYLTRAPLDSEEAIIDNQKWLALVTSVIPHSSDPDFDLKIMRLVAERLSNIGHAQQARDLVEQILLNSTETPRRRRLGWFAMADIYHRCQNYLEAFLALACTFLADDAADEQQIFHETIGLARLCRDCGLHKQARLAIEQARRIIKDLELQDYYFHRLDTLELQIRQMEWQIGSSNKTELEDILADVVQNSKEILKYSDMTEPAAAMLGQLLRQARDVDATIPTEANDVYAELIKHTKKEFASLIDTMSLATPSAENLLNMLKTSPSPRYSSDVGYDMLKIVIVASRALSSDDYITNEINTSFALELLADRGVAMPGWDEKPEPPPALGDIDEAAEIASSISREGVSVVQAGFDSSGRLVRVSTVNGQIKPPLREPENIMNAERFKIWSKKYPYAYGIDEESVNQFYTTTTNLRLSSLPQGPVVIVADVRFQSFPPNLFYVDEEFAGRKQAMATTPSLTWLKKARSQGVIGDGRLCAWISTAIGSTENQTLSMIAQRLESTFDQYGFLVDNSQTLPATFAGASIAVITAHGGIHPEGQYFKVVSDEGVLKVSARDLANALHNVDIVILFVCSGGRADKHPGSHTTLGLAKEILDRGCGAVIASSWPLDARVPSHWLPIFLEHWFQGDMLTIANFYANKAVDQYFSQDPARGLAMTIFGNPLLRRT